MEPSKEKTVTIIIDGIEYKVKYRMTKKEIAPASASASAPAPARKIHPTSKRRWVADAQTPHLIGESSSRGYVMVQPRTRSAREPDQRATPEQISMLKEAYETAKLVDQTALEELQNTFRDTATESGVANLIEAHQLYMIALRATISSLKTYKKAMVSTNEDVTLLAEHLAAMKDHRDKVTDAIYDINGNKYTNLKEGKALTDGIDELKTYLSAAQIRGGRPKPTRATSKRTHPTGSQKRRGVSTKVKDHAKPKA